VTVIFFAKNIGCTPVHPCMSLYCARPWNPHSGSTKWNVFAFGWAEMEKSSGSSNKHSACNHISHLC